MPAPRSDSDFNPPVGWLASEKYDGYRARWMGKMKDEDQKVFSHKEDSNDMYFKLAMPDENIDGELWVGRKFPDDGC